MAVLRERVEGWLYRLGAEKWGDPYTAVVVVTDDGWAKGLTGRASPVLLRRALRQAEKELGCKIKRERYKNMSEEKKFNGNVSMDYRDAESGEVKASLEIQYFGLDKKHVELIEGAVVGGLLALKDKK